MCSIYTHILVYLLTSGSMLLLLLLLFCWTDLARSYWPSRFSRFRRRSRIISGRGKAQAIVWRPLNIVLNAVLSGGERANKGGTKIIVEQSHHTPWILYVLWINHLMQIILLCLIEMLDEQNCSIKIFVALSIDCKLFRHRYPSFNMGVLTENNKHYMIAWL